MSELNSELLVQLQQKQDLFSVSRFFRCHPGRLRRMKLRDFLP